jgi:hypothetical protein
VAVSGVEVPFGRTGAEGEMEMESRSAELTVSDAVPEMAPMVAVIVSAVGDVDTALARPGFEEPVPNVATDVSLEDHTATEVRFTVVLSDRTPVAVN